uniref:Putative DNA binding, helix-turn-helix domain containing protein n=1 Tax=viral metagenome TaxID=1070528 RepID=A0A6H1ZUH8_9ZZZZ
MTPEGLIQLAEQCITIKDLAKISGHTEEMLRYYCRQGKFKYEKIEGVYYIYKSSIAQLIKDFAEKQL